MHRTNAQHLTRYNTCPCCGSDQIEGATVNADTDRATQNVTCNTCRAEYVEFYQLTGYQVTQEPDTVNMLREKLEQAVDTAVAASRVCKEFLQDPDSDDLPKSLQYYDARMMSNSANLCADVSELEDLPEYGDADTLREYIARAESVTTEARQVYALATSYKQQWEAIQPSEYA